MTTKASINLLEVLEDKEKELSIQLEQLRIAIAALKKGGLFKFLWEGKDEVVSDTILSAATKSITIPSEESIANSFSFTSYDFKVKEALKELKKGSITEIYNYWLNKGDKTNQARLFKGLTLKASQLYRAGELSAVRDGKKYVYSLK